MDNCYSDFINMNEMELSRALSNQKSKKKQTKQETGFESPKETFS